MSGVVIEDFRTYAEWLLPTAEGVGAIIVFLGVVALLVILALFFSYLIAAARHGPVEGFYAVARVIAKALGDDLPNGSLRRVVAIGRLAVQESIRRWVLVVFAVFILVMLFAGWFLDVQSENPALIYLSFVLTATNYLLLLLALMLATFSIPNDIKNRTIYTVVTKPVRAGEIVLGRILGFGLVGTALLVTMCGISYIFVLRGLDHAHEAELATLDVIQDELGNPVEWRGVTTFDAHHRHSFTVREDAQGRRVGQTDRQKGHRHHVELLGEGDDLQIRIGAPSGALQARVPVFGTLRFLDRQGQPGPGIDVGQEWGYYRFVDGGTFAAAIWTFEGITPDRFPDGLPIELDLRVFRTHKGDIERGVGGEISLRHPTQDVETVRQLFESREYEIDRHFIPRTVEIEDAAGSIRQVDLFEELVEDGRIEVWVRCADPGQLLGMARPSCYLRTRDASFAVNFMKGYTGIWMQMMMVIAFGVMFSTFLSGPVALLATTTSMILGHFVQFIVDVATGELAGGGPIESFFRTVTQQNVAVPLEFGPVLDNLIRGADFVLLQLMQSIARLFPRYGEFNLADQVALGMNIPPDLFGRYLTITLAYLLVVTVVGYFCLKTREIAA